MIKTAVLGGAFDPVHTEHINIALATVKELKITKLILLPSYNPPHKSIVGEDFTHRVKMLKTAFKNFPVDVEISTIEEQNKGKNYTVRNLPKLKDKYGEFYFIIGGDSLLNLENWYMPEKLVKLTNLVVFNRDGFDDVTPKIKMLEKKWGCSIKKMEYTGKNVSSTDIRTRLFLDMETDRVGKDVLDIIKYEKFYNYFDNLTEKAKGYLSETRFFHSKNVTLMAENLNSYCNLGLPYKKVFKAAILHDIGKRYDKLGIENENFNIPKKSVGTPVQHQFIGKILAESDFNIKDRDILNAIKYHTTGRAKMSLLEKLIFVSDMISYERNYIGIDRLRDAVYNDFNNGFLNCINYSYEYLLKANKQIYPLTMKAVEYYKENL